MSEFGRLLAKPTIERGAEVTLRYFLPVYLGEVLEQAGHARDGLPDPDDLVRQTAVEWPAVGQFALVIVASPGTMGDAKREAEHYRATYELTAGVLADLGDTLDSQEAAGFYAAAAGAALTHQGIAVVESDRRTWAQDEHGRYMRLAGSSVRWLGERATVKARRGGRALIAGEARFAVTVEGARSLYGGPDSPPVNPNEEPVPRDPEPADVTSPVVPTVTITRDPLEE